MKQKIQFTCVIEHTHLHDFFSATVIVTKKKIIELAEEKDRIALAHCFITPVSDHLRAQYFPFSPIRQAHNHFILYDFTGRGKYIVRNRYDFTIERLDISIWDLGCSFAIQTMKALTELS
jgi:hypothetical protein